MVVFICEHESDWGIIMSLQTGTVDKIAIYSDFELIYCFGN